MSEKAPKSAAKVPFEGNAVPSPSSRRQLAGQQQQEIVRMFGFLAPRARAKMLLFFLQVLYMFCVKVIHRLSSLENKGRTRIFSVFNSLHIFA